jgi:phosphoribosyl 1,2-cyclic phosphodiesterase
MIGFCPLASGSKGNSIYVGTKKTRVLIDAGLSLSLIEKKLSEIDVSIESIQAVLITHEHSDHIKGLDQISKLGIPILANAETAKAMLSILKVRPRFKIFTTSEPFAFGDLDIMPFSVPHDTLDPVGFIVRMLGRKLGFCTDLGTVTSLVRKMLEDCQYLYLEANHQPSMVHASHRPKIYKDRVLSRQGHLSNEECADLLVSIAHKGLQHVHLAHLSSECNSEAIALKIVSDALLQKNFEIPISIAYQDRISKAIEFF